MQYAGGASAAYVGGAAATSSSVLPLPLAILPLALAALPLALTASEAGSSFSSRFISTSFRLAAFSLLYLISARMASGLGFITGVMPIFSTSLQVPLVVRQK